MLTPGTQLPCKNGGVPKRTKHLSYCPASIGEVAWVTNAHWKKQNLNYMRPIGFLAAVLACGDVLGQVTRQSASDPSFVEVRVLSSIDGTEQLNRVFVPESTGPKPLLVFLHSWSHGVEQDNTRWLDLAKQRRWAFLQPNFRGKNNRPDACGSELARQDILDAIKYVLTKTEIDRSRIYLAGTSGGGHMSLLMASYYPTKFSAVSSWVGISDLERWYSSTRLKTETYHYAKELEVCVGGAPGTSEAVDAELKMRSPLHHLAKAADVPMDINTGVYDGHTGSVPVSQSIEAFNAILRAKNKTLIPADELEKWTAAGASETTRQPSVEDSTYSRKVLFRSQANDSRLTIFDGAHEDLPGAGMAYLEGIQRQTQW